MTHEERIELLIEAQDNIRNAIGLIEDAVAGTEYENEASKNVIAHLESWSCDGFLAQGLSLDDLICRFEELDKEENE